MQQRRSYPKRQRCLAHLIRKAISITGAINQKAVQIGQWILDDLRALIANMAEGSEDNRLIRKLMAGLRRVCQHRDWICSLAESIPRGHLGQKADHTKLQALAKEIRLGLGGSGRFCEKS